MERAEETKPPRYWYPLLLEMMAAAEKASESNRCPDEGRD